MLRRILQLHPSSAGESVATRKGLSEGCIETEDEKEKLEEE